MNSTRLSDHLHEVLADVSRLRRRFAETAPRAWGPVTAAAELSVQVGHLASCLLRWHRTEISTPPAPQRPITKIGDELADVALAAASVSTLAGCEPAKTTLRQPQASNEVDAFFHLLVAAGNLSEAALVEHHYRHQPMVRPPALPEATASVIGACDTLANQLGLDLIAEFRAMVADADSFLDDRGVAR